MNNILIYKNNNGNIKVDIKFEDNSFWLSQAQICEVFANQVDLNSKLYVLSPSKLKEYKITLIDSIVTGKEMVV